MQNSEPLVKVDLFKSIIGHMIVLIIIVGGGYIQNRKVFLDLKLLNSSNNNSSGKTENISNTDNITPIKASLIDHKELQQAVKRQEKVFTDRVLREKKLEQQEQKIAKLVSATEQEVKKAKQEKEELKKDKDALKKEQENLQKMVNKFKQQQQELLTQQAKLEQLKQENLKKKLLTQQVNSANQNQPNYQSKLETKTLNQNSNTSNISGGASGNTTDSLQTEIQTYYGKMLAKIVSNRKVTTFFPEHLECAVRVKILPSGNLASIKLDKSSGNMAYDAFSEQAIYKSAPFDMPEDPKVNKELVEHELEFVFPAKLVSE